MTTYSKISIYSLVFTISMLVISSCSAYTPRTTPTLTSVTFTETLIPSFTPTVSDTPTLTNTPTPSSTSSPRPTKTPTPQPDWVTEFAHPILSTIADRTPNLQDEFGVGSAGWIKDYCEGSLKYIEEELVSTNCRFYRSNSDWRDFVLEVEMRFSEDTTTSGEFSLHFRDLGNYGHSLTLYHSGYLAISFTKAKGPSSREEYDFPTLSNNKIHHILLIAKGDQFAFYLDNQPLAYSINDEYPLGRWVFYVESGTVAIDNFKIWNIADISTP